MAPRPSSLRAGGAAREPGACPPPAQGVWGVCAVLGGERGADTTGPCPALPGAVQAVGR